MCTEPNVPSTSKGLSKVNVKTTAHKDVTFNISKEQPLNKLLRNLYPLLLQVKLMKIIKEPYMTIKIILPNLKSSP